ncbi:MAG: hypothetical protein J5634_03680 [Bacilli bacterium]|nr:hypothetical protein [Bacilli bacterium]
MSEFDFNYTENNGKMNNKKTKSLNDKKVVNYVLAGGIFLGGLTTGIIIGSSQTESDYKKTKEKECAAIVIQNGEIKVYDLGTQDVRKKMDKNYEKYYFEESKTAVYIIYGDEAFNRAQLITYNIELDKNNYLINDGLFSDEYYYEYKKLDENGVKTSSISRKAE